MECFTSLCDSASIDMDEPQYGRHKCDKMAQTYPVLGEIYCRKASLADLLASSELANYLIGFVFGVRWWWWATTHGSWWHSRSRHVCCDRCLIRLFVCSESSSMPRLQSRALSIRMFERSLQAMRA
jgi:hypothetical protein